MLLGKIVMKDGSISLQMAKHPNCWYPLGGSSRLAENFRETFNDPTEKDLGRELHQIDGVLQMSAPVESLPVIFRAERSGDFRGQVTAVFPTLPSDTAGRQMTCYAHVGQHSGCSVDWYQGTRPATEEEAAPLLAELRGIYEKSLAPGDPIYSLQVCKRIIAEHRRAFRLAMRRA
jgi:hypothetical protein